MATIANRKNKDGSTSYRVSIRRKNIEVWKTFHTQEDAEIYAFYKERLIDNLLNFDVPIEERLTLKQIFEIKLDESKNLERRSFLDLKNAFEIIDKYLDINRFLSDITFQDWEIVVQEMYKSDVFRGAKTEIGRRKMSTATLRRNFACYSSAFSTAISKGFKIENFPLKIMQIFINPLLKKEKATM